MIDATAIIMTKNEAVNIVDCLKSMENFAKRCVVIDCGSTDETVKLAEKNGADVYFHEFEYYAKQFNWGIENTNITTEWIIRLDADERFPEKLKIEIESIISNNMNTDLNGITIEAELFFLGRAMKHGMINKRKMMLFKKEYGYIEDRRRDAHSVISQGIVESTQNHFLHYDFKSLDSYIKRCNWYAIREMQDYIDFMRGQSVDINTDEKIVRQRIRKFGLYYKLPKYLRAWMLFVYAYIIKGGFLDGKEGFVFNFFDIYWYRVLVDAKIQEYEKNPLEYEKLKALD